jgi:hypothetical protein
MDYTLSPPKYQGDDEMSIKFKPGILEELVRRYGNVSLQAAVEQYIWDEEIDIIKETLRRC